MVKANAAEFSQNELLQRIDGSTKGVPGHNYARVYHAILGNKRTEIDAFCEIGLLKNALKSTKTEHASSPSLTMWQAYLPNAKIVGFDIVRFQQLKEERMVIIQGDQKSRDDLQTIINEQPTFDVIVDDGLHVAEHQQITFAYLFPHLKPGGIFFIEDLHVSHDTPKTRDVLTSFQNTGVWNSPFTTAKEKEYIEATVDDIHFYDSHRYRKVDDPLIMRDSLAVIYKKA